ncbi:hypothetical protein AAFG13_12665 [Bradyrhizobium sp. B124]|uniref:hypothetical protein n=1 Tax=Bradyrhizobium sp. B124 TaxID=3140245 RepID=UPI0031836BED
MRETLGLDVKSMFGQRVTYAVLALTCVAGQITEASAQNKINSAVEKWRPADGLYASPGKDFEAQCLEYGDFIIELSRNSVGGNEWGCKIRTVSDIADGTVRLDMSCNDYNLAETLGSRGRKAEDRRFQETMLVRRIDEKAISVRKTLDGKFKGAAWRADYCPANAQRLYADNKAQEERKAAEQKAMQHPWRPKPGVYATPGNDFSERCLQSGNTIIDLDQRSIASGTDKCGVTSIRDNLDNIQVFVACNTPPNPETVILKWIDDKTLLLQKSVNREFRDDGGPLAYCQEAAQHMYAATSKRRK